MYITSCEAVES